MEKIIVIGGGIIGMCTAYYCQKKGYDVTLLERGTPTRDCCSLGNAGLIVPSHIVPLAAPGMVSMGLRMMWNPESPFYIKPRISPSLFDWGLKFIRACSPEHARQSAPLLRDLNFASKRLFEGFAEEEGLDFGLEKRGLLNLCRTEERLHEEEEMAGQARSLGMRAEVLDAEETRKLDPDIQMNLAGSVYFPDDAHLSPNRFMSQLSALIQKLGVRIHWQNEVFDWEFSGDRISGVRTQHEMFQGDAFVIAGGAWSAGIGKQLGLRLPLQAGKGYSLTLDHPPQLPKLSYILTEARLAVTPMSGSLRFGGTMELAGLDMSVNSARIRGITRSVQDFFPAYPLEIFHGVQPWRGLRPCSPDGLPYIGRTALYQNLCIATGHAMMGLSLGPVTGKLVSQILSDEMPALDMELMNPDRYLDA